MDMLILLIREGQHDYSNVARYICHVNITIAMINYISILSVSIFMFMFIML